MAESPSHRREQIALAKELVREAGRYLDLRDLEHTGQLLAEAARIVEQLIREDRGNGDPSDAS
jgi:hypothetical protein